MLLNKQEFDGKTWVVSPTKRRARIEAIYQSLIHFGAYRLTFTEDCVELIITEQYTDQVYTLLKERLGIEVNEEILPISEGVSLFWIDGHRYRYNYCGFTMLDMYKELTDRRWGYFYNKIFGVPKEDLELMRKISIYDTKVELPRDFLDTYGDVRRLINNILDNEQVNLGFKYEITLKKGMKGKGLYITCSQDEYFVGDNIASIFEACMQKNDIFEVILWLFDDYLDEDEEVLLNTFLLYEAG